MTNCTYEVERFSSTHFELGEDDCDGEDCYQLADALLIVELGDELFNKVYCEGHLAIAVSLLHGNSPIG